MTDQASIIHKDTSTVVRVLGLRDETGAYVNTATVTMENLVNRETLVQVTGLSYPVNMPYVTLSNGNYAGALIHNIPVVVGQTYIATFKAIGPLGGIQKTWKETVRCQDAVA